jgi:hypothetical protein
MESALTGSFVEVKFATPVESTHAVPSVVALLTKVTVPVGTAEPEPDTAATVATSSTGKPCVAVGADAVRARVLCCVGTVTVSVFALDVDAE